MNRRSEFDRLDDAIEVLLARKNSVPQMADQELGDLLHIAAELQTVPSPKFKAQLKAELQQSAAGRPVAVRDDYAGDRTPVLHMTAIERQPEFLPTLFGLGSGNYPVHGTNFLASFLLHSAAVAVVVTSGMWMVQHRQEITAHVVPILTEPSAYVVPAARDESHGGGGGGDQDKLQASKGVPPRFANEQVAPPAIVVRTDHAKLTVEPTLVGPPNITFPTGQMGDPLAGVIGPASNGPGSGGGIGNGTGGGVGPGTGPGLGPGTGGGFGGGVYRVGGGVTAPRAIYDPEPEYSEEARKAKYQGVVGLVVIVGPDGRPRDLRVARSLGMGLDEKAMEAVRKWRFSPALKDGKPVAVIVGIEVSFRLY